MKKIFTYLAVLLIATGIPAIASAANLTGQKQYKITSYTLSSDSSTDEAGSSLYSSPLLITGATSEVLGENFYGSSEYGFFDPRLTTDVFAVSADFTATADIQFHGSIGITKNRWDSSLDPDYNSSWEANLGVIYNLFNNIRYELHFGYMDTGDLFKESNSYSDVDSIIMISNKLTMSF